MIPAAFRPPAATPGQATARPTADFREPVVILSAPRSGSTLLFETLANAPGLHSIGGESHRAIEGLPGLHPNVRGFDSNRLTADDARPEVVASVRRSFSQTLRDRDGRPPAPGAPVRLLEKTPKNILRLPFLQRVFPDARFVYLFREPRDVLASMMEAWRSGRFRTYPNLPGWTGDPWSLLLVPGWREFIGRPLEEIVAHQWTTATTILLDDLETLPRSDWIGLRYDELIARPQDAVDRLCAHLGLTWDVPLDSLPLSRHTLTPPDPDKWRRHESALARVLPGVAAVQARAARIVGS